MQAALQAKCGAVTTVVILTILFLNSISVKSKSEQLDVLHMKQLPL